MIIDSHFMSQQSDGFTSLFEYSCVSVQKQRLQELTLSADQTCSRPSQDYLEVKTIITQTVLTPNICFLLDFLTLNKRWLWLILTHNLCHQLLLRLVVAADVTMATPVL